MFVFFGTSQNSAKFLEILAQQNFFPELVVSAPPKPIGRKKTLSENPVVSLAKKINLPFLTNQKEILKIPPPKLGLILDFNKIIPKEIIDFFQKGIINIHFSKLPQYRGPAPVQYTILNGDKKAWITYYLIDENLDTGKIIAQTFLPLDQTETTETLYQKLIAKASQEIKEVIDKYLSGQYIPKPQSGKASYTQKLTSENCQINWEKSPQEAERLIRAAYPEPGAWTLVITKPNEPPKRLKILKAHLENNHLVLDQVQLEGKKPVSWKQFQEGYPNHQILK